MKVSLVTLETRQWSPQLTQHAMSRKHVYSDLRPYICLEKECTASNAEQEFSRRHEWMNHIQQNHWNSYTCLFGCSSTFSSPSQFKDHLFKNHSNSVSQDHADALVKLAAQPLDIKDGIPCPICGDAEILTSANQYRWHVGRHQEQLSLFALPRSATDEDGEVESDGTDEGRSVDLDFGREEANTKGKETEVAPSSGSSQGQSGQPPSPRYTRSGSWALEGSLEDMDEARHPETHLPLTKRRYVVQVSHLENDRQESFVVLEEEEVEGGIRELMSAGDNADELPLVMPLHAVESREPDRSHPPSQKRRETNYPDDQDDSDNTDLVRGELKTKWLHKRLSDYLMWRRQQDREHTIGESQETDDESKGRREKARPGLDRKERTIEDQLDSVRTRIEDKIKRLLVEEVEKEQIHERSEDEKETGERHPESLEDVNYFRRRDSSGIARGEEQGAKEHSRAQPDSEQTGIEKGRPVETSGFLEKDVEARLRFLRKQEEKHEQKRLSPEKDLADLDLRGNELDEWRRERDGGEAGGLEEIDVMEPIRILVRANPETEQPQEPTEANMTLSERVSQDSLPFVCRNCSPPTVFSSSWFPRLLRVLIGRRRHSPGLII